MTIFSRSGPRSRRCKFFRRKTCDKFFVFARVRFVQPVFSKLKSLPSILSVEKLSIVREGTLILDAVDWRVQPGEHWVMLGANGSGKTSLLSALTGYLMPTSGEVSLLGKIYGESDWRELRKKIGLVSSSIRQMINDEEPALESVASGKYAMINFWGRVTRAEKIQARKLLRQVECEYLADRPWRVLSQGERQRVLIGRALMAQPRVLILDEPCAGLDPAAREHFLQFIQRLGAQKNSPTLVLVTHHVEEIMPVFSHLLLLQAGRVQAAGKMAEVLGSKKLSQVFGTPMKLEKRGRRFGLNVQ